MYVVNCTYEVASQGCNDHVLGKCHSTSQKSRLDPSKPVTRQWIVYESIPIRAHSAVAWHVCKTVLVLCILGYTTGPLYIYIWMRHSIGWNAFCVMSEAYIQIQHGRSKRYKAGWVLARLLFRRLNVHVRTLNTSEVVRIRTSNLSHLWKRLPIIVQISLTKMR